MLDVIILTVKFSLNLALIAVCLLAVAAVFVSPSVDLPTTALNAQRAAVLVFLSIIFAAHRILMRPRSVRGNALFVSEAGASPVPFSGQPTLTCALLC